MLNRTAQDWERLRALPALLKVLPALADELGFHFYSFSYFCPDYEVHAGNLPSDGERLVQTALDLSPSYRQHATVPVRWTEDAFLKQPQLWKVAQKLGLRHGLIQPLHDGVRQSSLALLRPDVCLSAQELYQQAGHIRWLIERLHLAATQGEQR
ncbi:MULTISPECIES: autoinducer binding domain-containing protein [unclassified Pseudomonas]|uniref:autoinducer binding domain-containing protein n=1 Tax=unclassified Pseudomonas TaxID=196821 RepID=UPI000A15079B